MSVVPFRTHISSGASSKATSCRKSSLTASAPQSSLAPLPGNSASLPAQHPWFQAYPAYCLFITSSVCMRTPNSLTQHGVPMSVEPTPFSSALSPLLEVKRAPITLQWPQCLAQVLRHLNHNQIPITTCKLDRGFLQTLQELVFLL